MSVKVWSVRDHFVSLNMRVIEFSGLRPKDFLLAWFRKFFEKERS